MNEKLASGIIRPIAYTSGFYFVYPRNQSRNT